MKRIGTLLLLLVFLTACGAPSSAAHEAQQAQSSIYTDLGAPKGLSGRISRMESGGQTCYLMWGGTGVSVSCPATPKAHGESVIYTDLGHPKNLSVMVAEMRDGEQICYLIWGGTQVDISCP